MKNTVELIGVYGSDESHAISAWTSTSRGLDYGKKDRMPQIIKFLAQNGHHTPFEKSTLHFLVNCDTASHIHFLKHRVGVSINGESARYKEHTEDKYLIPADWPEEAQESIKQFSQEAFDTYHKMVDYIVDNGLDRKRAKESARFFLPYSSQVTIDVSFNFRSFMHFQNLRNKPDAQVEIREIAQSILDLVRASNLFTHSLEGFGYGE